MIAPYWTKVLIDWEGKNEKEELKLTFNPIYFIHNNLVPIEIDKINYRDAAIIDYKSRRM